MPDWHNDRRPDRHADWRPDWYEEASRKLASSKLSAAEREEISRELAGYLDDLCSDAPSRGLDNSAAAQTAAAELHEDKHLGAHLFRSRKESAMNDRTKQLWLPCMAMLLASIALLTSFRLPGLSHPEYGTLWLRSGAAHWRELFWRIYGSRNIAWLCILSFFGAAGAYWSRRARSGRAMQAAVGLSPLFLFTALFGVMVQYSFDLDGVPAANVLLAALAVNALKWVIIPGVALLLGVLPFLRASNSQRRVA